MRMDNNLHQQQQQQQGRVAMQWNNMACLAIVASMLLLATIPKTQAHNPTSADCMSNPFASQCRGISAKRSESKLANNHFDGHNSLAAGSWNPWQNLPAPTTNRIHHQAPAGSLSDLLMRLESGSQTEQVVSRPIVGKLYLYEQLPAPTVNTNDPTLDLVEGREEH